MVRFLFRRSFLLGMGAAMLFLFGAANARAAFDAFLKIEGIDGTATDAAHMNWIEVQRVVSGGDLNAAAEADREASAPSVAELAARKAGGSQTTVGSATGGAGAGKVTAGTPSAASGMSSGRRQHQPLVVIKMVDKASPVLAQACATGKHFSMAEVDVASGGSFMRYELTDVIIASVQKSSGGDRPTESITLNYTKIEYKNQKQK